MKKLRVFLAITAIFAITIMGCSSSSNSNSISSDTVSITILQTSDVHDHAEGYGSVASYSPLVTGNDSVLGGYARLAAYISGVKNEKGANSVLLCDSGDFTMGTVYSMTLQSTPLSAMFLAAMNYDAITIGNHETDFGPDALAGFITLAKNNAEAPFVSPILASNMDATASPAIDTLVGNGTIVKNRIIEKAGIKIGLLGQMGANADFDSTNALPLTFNHDYSVIQSQVNALRSSGAQLVVLLSHEGFTVNTVTGFAEGNDAELAKAVTGIDVILSGHLHLNQTAVKAAADRDTILVSPGEYGEHIARLDLKVNKYSGKVTGYTSTNVTINDSIKGDPFIEQILLTRVNPALNTALAPAFIGLGLTGVNSILDTVAINNAPITAASITPGYRFGESVLGNLAADSFRNAINGIWASAYAAHGEAFANAALTAATGDSNRVQMAFVPGGIIRDPLAVSPPTHISFADLYNAMPLGSDPLDPTVLGYPLLTTYIKAADVYTIAGISLQMGMAAANSDYVINFAGMYVQILPTTSLSGVGYDVYLCPTDTNASSPNYGMNDNIPGGTGTFINPGDGGTLYKISIDLYTLMMMYKVHDLYSTYVVNTYDSLGRLLPDYGAAGNRVKTGATTTMRGWQAIVGWSWAASGGATSNLSSAGYTSGLPYRRVK